ncbi:hypothetical protein AvCA_03730 [Azotobacter vinelandii CA]|uniref:Uncharacterized protein n=2 Tax=Azotobacter vinelandii TaxID=354 RepID=C1DID6_AZOVD|nr:hypothetical protein Avin_03730 [Azotobacter vinelandii DJ]AGK15626.1 hypothetical protein AvCA_03730 [Azotobacter vinelandii CA]AGK19251.1 hypothetical protein AvCA6_03730 [Azotobacter vinelandii CA6]
MAFSRGSGIVGQGWRKVRHAGFPRGA